MMNYSTDAEAKTDAFSHIARQHEKFNTMWEQHILWLEVVQGFPSPDST